ncbi:MAG TPA: DNA-deoxyinosine glycosylase [Caulobacteraceae bacterium]|jgi:hypoxanthine-DNA glycosylase
MDESAAEPPKASFAPVASARTRLLVLGSLPGEVSLRRAQYYGHPQNQFWRLMGRVLGAEPPAGYEARLAALFAAGVGLWDVVRTARRAGSLDAAIRDHAPNPLAEFIATLPQLRAVAFNGGTASAIGRRALGEVEGVELVTLPSSSPAYTLAFERKAEAWAQLRRFL